MRSSFLLLIATTLAAVLMAACDDGSPEVPADPGIAVKLTADRSPSYMGTATLSCSYKVTSHLVPVGRDDYIAEGHFAFPSTHFAVVSGESSWVDTLRAQEVRNHKVVVKALVRGDWLVDALVRSVIEDSVTIIGGGDSIELHVR